MKVKNTLLIATALAFFTGKRGFAQQAYKIQPVTIQTRWAKQVSPENALPEYPRPQMVRANWTNLNGLWDYAIRPIQPNSKVLSEGKILVPYPIESALSGVKKSLLPDQELLYKRNIQKPQLQTGERVWLHFGAVDWKATVYLNSIEVGSHEGGYTNFSVDITPYLNTGENQLIVKVLDPTDKGVGPHGKQVLNPQNIYYTPSSGIWQTVWMETVAPVAISSLDLTPDIDKGVLNAYAWIDGSCKDCTVAFTALDGGKIVASTTVKVTAEAKLSNTPTGSLKIKNAKLWSPASPFLYDLNVKVIQKGKVIDQVKSYFGMRKIGIAKDVKGIDRIFLNNKPFYHLGTLDQGFWPEGLYTAPTDEALAFDIKAIKAMGFNTIRKHIKVEPARWYHYADKLGMLVWQDFVNPNQALPEGSKSAFEAQCKETMQQLHNYPSIVTWVLFNEKWGQYDQKRLSEWIKHTDPSRILNGHSGEILYVNEAQRSPSPDAYVSSDLTDIHSYPDPMNSLDSPGKARVCGEFGGIGVFIPDHQWLSGSAWGYITEKPAGLLAKYKIMNQHLELLQKEGLSGSIYTQPFDVEGEQNGLMTYDREVVKIPFTALRKIHSALNPEMGTIPLVTAKDADLQDPGMAYSLLLDQYIKGNREPAFLKKVAMMATQSGDKTGAAIAAKAYISGLRAPLNEEDMNTVIAFTKTTKDPGFEVLRKNETDFKRNLGDRKYANTIMNLIYRGEIEPFVNAASTVDWNKIATAVAPFGLLGEEIYLRAKTVAFYNEKNWKEYATAAKVYLEKYGKGLSDEERSMFQKAVDEHQ